MSMRDSAARRATLRTMIAPLLVVLVHLAGADFYDVIERHKLPPAGVECLEWSSLPEWDRYWTAGKPPVGVGASCVQHGRGNPLEPCAHSQQYKDCIRNETGWDQPSYGLSYCVSKLTGNMSFCSSALGVPEQINIQIASSSAVVVGWVTFEARTPARAPSVFVSRDLSGSAGDSPAR
jgi:hypothetical protein